MEAGVKLRARGQVKSRVPLSDKAKSSTPRSFRTGEEGMSHAIFELPEGVTTKTYSKYSAGERPFWFWILEYEEFGLAASVSYDDQGNVYFCNFISSYQLPCYVVGKLNEAGDKITVSLPQDYTETYVDETNGCFWLQLSRIEEFYEGTDGNMYAKTAEGDANKVVFNVAADGTITMEDNCMVGLVYNDDSAYEGYCDNKQVYTPIDESLLQPVELPADFTGDIEQWSVNPGYDYGYLANVAIDGTDIYIRGLFGDLPEAWIKGRIQGDKVIIEPNQYMGVYQSSYFIFLVLGQENPAYDPNDDMSEEPDWILAPEGSTFVFNYDATAKRLTTATTEFTLFANAALDRIYSADSVTNPELKFWELKPMVPADPYNLFYGNYYETYGYNYLSFDMPMFNADGDLLDVTKYYYNIWTKVDGENSIVTFYDDDYPSFFARMGIEEIMYIPFSGFDDMEASEFYSIARIHAITIYFNDYDDIGVQGVYIVNGVENRSRIVWFVSGESGTEAIASERAVESVSFYDLTGCSVKNPANGLFIRRTVYSDGSVEFIKELVK